MPKPGKRAASARQSASAGSLSPAARLLAASGTRGPIAQGSVSKIEALSFDGLFQAPDQDPLVNTTSGSPILNTHPPNSHDRTSFSSPSKPRSPLSSAYRNEEGQGADETSNETEVLRHLKTSLRSRLDSDQARKPRSSDDSSKSPTQPQSSSSNLNSRRNSLRFSPADSGGSKSKKQNANSSLPQPQAYVVRDGYRTSPPDSIALLPTPVNVSTPRLPDIPVDDSFSTIQSSPLGVTFTTSTTSQSQTTDCFDQLRSTLYNPSLDLDQHDLKGASTLQLKSTLPSNQDILPIICLPIIGLKLSPPHLAQTVISRYPTSNSTPIFDITMHLIILPFTTAYQLLPTRRSSCSDHINIILKAVHDAFGLFVAGSWRISLGLINYHQNPQQD
ncbi:hypothetical protein CROQUDRAFT_111142 [Cronartium quercuum f. sp. fusiforme G11]|uniref:Uncharacterized protein n=1 Tax=Cronartium quercuum f. sp. fusiforme G11 TaxID=708437 RepID=A0A9P6NAW2_9BASI|nr:hypothetical protein CROQUDRAFT_111142 [Cronartium quercuum f. sp. fusiforme G11]